MGAFVILIIYQCFYVLQPHNWPIFGLDIATPITMILLFLALLAFIFSSAKKYYSPQFILLCCLCPVIVLSATANGWMNQGVFESQVFILTAVIPFLLYSNLLSTNKRQEALMLICVISALFMLWNGLSQKSSADGMGWAGTSISQGTRITYLGILEDPNDLGGFFVLCLPFAGYFAAQGSNFFLRLFGKVNVGLMLYGIYLTNSRGALLASLVVVASYLIYRYGNAKAVFMGILGIPGLVFVISNFRSIDANEESASGRTEAWYAGFQMLSSNPIFGVGKGNFLEYHVRTAHNSFVLVMAELGALGYAIWFCSITLSLFMLFVALKHYRAFMRETKFKVLEKTEAIKAMSINSTLFFSFLGYLTTAFFLTRSYNFLMFFLCAMALASYQRVIVFYPELKFKNMANEVKKFIYLSFLSIVGMYFVIKVVL